MSIYATLWVLKFPKHGDDFPGCEWIDVVAQGVPRHIRGQLDFLPLEKAGFEPARDDMKPRAVVFITQFTRKGTDRSGQEYVDPLLVLSGEEYERIPFVELHEILCTALRGDRSRPVIWAGQADGSTRAVFEDHSVVTVPPTAKDDSGA